MKIEIDGDTVRIEGTHKKGIIIYHNEDNDSFSMSVFQNGFEHGCLPTITFCKDHTVCLNNREKGKSFID
jgi:hypothetical protein